MQALHRETSIIQQPDGELIRAIIDPATVSPPGSGIQFELGVLAQKVLQDKDADQLLQRVASQDASLLDSRKLESSSSLQAMVCAYSSQTLLSLCNLQLVGRRSLLWWD